MFVDLIYKTNDYIKMPVRVSQAKNKLYYGDNLDVMRRYIKDETVDLCYCDPPFNSKRNYNQIYNNIGSDDKAQAQAFIDTWTWDDEAVRGFDEDVRWLSTQDKERLGYPTQKPEGLLDRIINASSNAGDLVLDAFCGCGTTTAVSEKLSRSWIGIDITYQSISLILKRLEDHFGKESLDNIEINGIPEDFESAVALAHKKDDKLRKEFEKWAVLTYSSNRAIINEKKGSDSGIDGIAYMQDRNENSDIVFKQVLFSVKSDKSPHVSQIRDLHGAIEREKAAMGYFITLFPPTKDMILECKQIGKYKNSLMEHEYPKIEIITVKEMLEGKRISIPTSHEVAVIKAAERKKKDGQMKLGLE